MFELIKYLHLLAMVIALTAAVIPGLVLLAVARRGDVAAIRSLAPLARSVRAVAPALFVVGAIFGFAAAVAGGVDPLRPWLIGSYVAFTVALLAGAALGDPWARRLGDAALASPSDRPSSAMVAAINDPRGVLSTAVPVLCVAVIIFLAAIKPGG